MSANRKPRKPYRPKHIIQPLKIRNDWLLEGGCLAALTAIKAGCHTDQHLNDLGAHAMLVQRLAAEGSPERRHAQAIIRTVSGIIERGYASKSDIEAIDASASITTDWLRAQRNYDIARASIALVREFDIDTSRNVKLRGDQQRTQNDE